MYSNLSDLVILLIGDMLNLCEFIMGQTIIQEENENDPDILKVLKLENKFIILNSTVKLKNIYILIN